jgi:TIR domain
MSDPGFIVVHRTELLGHQGQERVLEICVGDITHTDGPVDLLCLSAFPGDYTPTPSSVVGSLHARGIDVRSLAATRDGQALLNRHCWVSSDLQHPIRRLLCFEHLRNARTHSVAGGAPGLVGDVFRAISEFVLARRPDASWGGAAPEPLGCVRIPALSSGDQGGSVREMLGAILRQGYIHLRGELPVRRLQIVLHPGLHGLHGLLVHVGETLEALRVEGAGLVVPEAPVHHLFVSYLHRDRDQAESIWSEMKAQRPDLSLFIDSERLAPGHFWKMELMKGLMSSSRSLCIITDGYPESGECMDEFHASMSLHLARRGQPFLLPLFLLRQRDLSTLPASMLRVQGLDSGRAGGDLSETVSKLLAHVV